MGSWVGTLLLLIKARHASGSNRLTLRISTSSIGFVLDKLRGVPAQPITALYDRNVLSWLDKRPDDLALVLQAVEEGRLRFIYTHILDDELKPPTVEEMERLTALRQRLGGEEVQTAAWVWDVSSTFNQDKFASDELAELYNALRVAGPDEEGQINNVRDALLTLTADGEGAVMVSDDIDLVKRAQAHGIDAVRPAEFVERVRN